MVGIRHLDELGRIVIPKDVRKQFDLREGTALKIVTSADEIILTREVLACRICQTTDNPITYNGFTLCHLCLDSFNGVKTTA